MSRPRRVLAAVLGLAVWAAVTGSAGAKPIDARIVGTFQMTGRITAALRVAGEQPGEIVRRRWTFTGSGCGRTSCRALSLRRERSAGLLDTLMLHRAGAGRYTGTGTFFAALECRGAFYPQGEMVPYRVTVFVTRAVDVGGVLFAAGLRATYTNPRRIDRTICPIGPSYDAAFYSGAPARLPRPPHAGFTARINRATDRAAFHSTSRRGRSGARIVAYRWRFGDPRSGAGDSSRGADPRHRFSAPGTYTVTLTVIDADGLRSTVSHRVVAPGPPTAAFADREIGTTSTYGFTDTSARGPGGARISAWSWTFGDPASGAADTSTRADPLHTFTVPGTYTVTLTVTDANHRSATTSAAVTVPPATG